MSKFVPIRVQPESVVDCFIKHVMPNARPHWNTDKITTLSNKSFEEGYSNHIVGIRQDGAEDDDVILFRVDSSQLSLFLTDREAECEIMEVLHQIGMNPPVYCRYNNAICYGYTPGRPLTLDDLTNVKILKCIAVTMARYHNIDYKRLKKVDCWVDRISSLLPDSVPDDSITYEIEKNVATLSFLRKEFEDAKVTLQGFKHPKALCHNDVHMLNIIYNEKREKVCFIDQETAAMAHISCEIGNFFRYFVGVFEDLDFDRYPDEVVQKEFIRMYLEEKSVLEGINQSCVVIFVFPSSFFVHEVFNPNTL